MAGDNLVILLRYRRERIERTTGRRTSMTAVLLSIFFYAGFPPADIQAGVLERKGLTRTSDPLIISENQLRTDLQEYLDTPVDRLGLYAFREDRFVAIPFQIDQRDGQGRHLLPGEEIEGSGAEWDLLDKHDEPVFLARDLGDRVSTDLWPADRELGKEISVRDPLTGEKGWAYLFAFPGPPERSETCYVSCRSDAGLVETQVYSAQLSGKDALSVKSLKITDEAGGDGLNLLSGLHVQIHLWKLDGASRIVTGEDFRIERRGWVAGPVRTTRILSVELKLPGMTDSPSVEVSHTFYPDFFLLPLDFSFPLNLGSGFSNANLVVFYQLDPQAVPMQFHTPSIPIGTLSRGRIIPEDCLLPWGQADWIDLTGPHGSLTTSIEAGADSNLSANLYLRRTGAGRRGGPCIGFDVVDLVEQWNQRSSLAFYTFILDTMRIERNKADYTELTDNPLHIAIHPGIRAENAIQRPLDAVIVGGNGEGADPGGIIGAPLTSIGLSSYLQGQLTPIPFQIDEKDADGRYVHTQGEKTVPDDGPGVFDASDELVFMAGDLGDRMPREGLLANGGRALQEIEITDPLNSAKGWTYIIVSDDPPVQHPSSDYVHYQPETETISTEAYRLSHNKSHPLLTDHFSIAPEANGHGKNFVDSLKMQFAGSIFFGMVMIPISGEDLDQRRTGWIDGPVRVIRSIDITRYGFKLNATICYYPRHFEYSIYLERMPLYTFLITKGKYRLFFNFGVGAAGAKFFNSNNRVGATLNGDLSEDERGMDLGPFDWYIVSGPMGSFLLKHDLYFNILNPLRYFLYYDEGCKTPRPREIQEGCVGSVGFEVFNIESAKRSDRIGSQIHIFIMDGPYQGSEEDLYTRVTDAELIPSLVSIDDEDR